MMVLDNRLRSYKSIDRVSVLTLSGRVVLPFVFGNYGGEGLSLKREQRNGPPQVRKGNACRVMMEASYFPCFEIGLNG